MVMAKVKKSIGMIFISNFWLILSDKNPSFILAVFVYKIVVVTSTPSKMAFADKTERPDTDSDSST